ncbi:toxin Y4kP [Synergistales bacterium]|nr:toxin Y4kP [Synergistales bacterium]
METVKNMRLQFTKLANEDLNHAYDYIAQDNPSTANAVIERIAKAVATIREYPSIGKKGRVNGTREFLASNTPFVLVYRINKNVLHILTILHTSKNYP